jgi:hypothetical protein
MKSLSELIRLQSTNMTVDLISMRKLVCCLKFLEPE